MTSRRYAAYPTATLYEFGTAPDKEPPERLKARKQLLWGDELKVIGASKDGAFLEVLARNVHGWIKLGETQEQRLLEVVFVDIGQGDGALLVTPDTKRYLVDAGKGDNMLRFLRWRFGFKYMTTFDAAVLSHSDADHYGGFEDLLKEANLHIKRIYTNGLMERAADKKGLVLGTPTAAGGEQFITELVASLDEFRRFCEADGNLGEKTYPTMLAQALQDGKFDGCAGRHRQIQPRRAALAAEHRAGAIVQGSDQASGRLASGPETACGCHRRSGDAGGTRPRASQVRSLRGAPGPERGRVRRHQPEDGWRKGGAGVQARTFDAGQGLGYLQARAG